MPSEDESRDGYLRGRLEPGESVVAAGSQAVVTERRILFAWKLHWPPHAGEWTHDSLRFDEISRWSEGRRHDERPLLRLEHPSHARLECVPGHRFLWFRWGNATGEVAHHETRFEFAGQRDPVFEAMRERLSASDAAQGEPFEETLPGTREERLGRTTATLVVIPEGRFGRRLARVRGRIARFDHDLHSGHITWWIRVSSWLLLAVPAWFVSPWLVLPAVALVELAWVVGLQWSRHRDQRRRAVR